MYAELAAYVAPKRKAVEHSAADDGPLVVELVRCGDLGPVTSSWLVDWLRTLAHRPPCQRAAGSSKRHRRDSLRLISFRGFPDDWRLTMLWWWLVGLWLASGAVVPVAWLLSMAVGIRGKRTKLTPERREAETPDQAHACGGALSDGDNRGSLATGVLALAEPQARGAFLREADVAAPV
jgi:hypothetical protein